MKKLPLLFVSCLTTLLLWSQKPVKKEGTTGKVYRPVTSTAAPAVRPKTPDEIWGKLFVDVQLNRVLGDNKTFVDAVPKFAPAVILNRFAQQQKQQGASFNLKSFVEEHFQVPVDYNPALPTKVDSLKDHLQQLWPVLTRKADVKQPASSLLPLPNAYVVPGGRFREIYYWDSYFTMLGLAESGRYDLIENMLDNFRFLINTYGHIPNGNRTYYLSRSQPPYFALMVELLAEKQGDRIYHKYLSALQKEYAWWMEGAEKLVAGEQHRRVVKLKDGTLLNRYFDDRKIPRQESYYEDVQTGLSYKNNDKAVYTYLRAGAESGWDFSSRWFADTVTLATIETINIVPVDLNCLLYRYELILANALSAQQSKAQLNKLVQAAEKRKQAILQYCWNAEKGYFFDYHLQKGTTTNKFALAGVMPLFTGMATSQQAASVKQQLENRFLKDGGLVTSLYHTGQQWDAPNGWAPLQYLSVKSLLNYGYDNIARDIAERWMLVNEKVYASTGKMMEKYNVENIQLESGGGEYPSQDGFGWSNGVYLKFYSMFRRPLIQQGKITAH